MPTEQPTKPMLSFADISPNTPDLEALSARMSSLQEALGQAHSAEECAGIVGEWDGLRRSTETWSSLVDLRFNQDTTNEQYRRDHEECDELTPRITELDVAMKNALLAHPLRQGIEGLIGTQPFALWETEVLAFDPAIKDDLVAESKSCTEYVELLASAELEFRGETLNLSTITKHTQDPDRQVRHDSMATMWAWFADNSDELDRIYGDLVQLRTRIAHKLEFEDYVALGYKRMSRIDYGREDVERFRADVREHVVPLATELCAQQAEDLGVEKLMAWDEAVKDPSGNPKPKGDHDWMVERAQEMFDEMGGGLGEFFRLMNEGGFLDLKARKGKAGGGFCTSFPTEGMPFIYANFNGTKGDVEVFTHEMGHAFQCYQSRNHSPIDLIWPTMESAEVHSMSLEFLTWPQMDRFFGKEDAERFRRMHLTDGLLFLPYGVAVDHFQHEVYSNPDASPAQRHEMWQEMERTYLPWRDWGDLAYPAKGGRWQFQRHIYSVPFYYIDYTLAQTCAMQFLARAEQDREDAMSAYVALCKRGGQAPFQQLAHSAGLKSPFKPGCLEEVVSRARALLG